MTPAFARGRFHSLQNTVRRDWRRVAATASLARQSANKSRFCSNDLHVINIGPYVFAGVEHPGQTVHESPVTTPNSFDQRKGKCRAISRSSATPINDVRF